MEGGLQESLWDGYLHVGDLILLPVEALHLVLLQLQAGLHILVVVTLEEERGISPLAWGSSCSPPGPATTARGQAHKRGPTTLDSGSRASLSQEAAASLTAQRLAPIPAHRVILELAVVHVDDVGADAVQEVLRMGDEHQDALEPAEAEPEV